MSMQARKRAVHGGPRRAGGDTMKRDRANDGGTVAGRVRRRASPGWRQALAAGLLALGLAGAAGVAQAANVTLTGWAFGGGGQVDGNLYRGAAGGFVGSLTGAGPLTDTDFITYCIELEEQFSFSNKPMQGYTIVPGATYFGEGRSESIGRLMTFALGDPTRVDAASESTSLQLAIWNLVYDGDASLASGGVFSDRSSFAAYAEWLLQGGLAVGESQYDVFALERAGTQDFLLIAPRPLPGSNQQVPIAPTWALLAAALMALQAARRRMRARH